MAGSLEADARASLVSDQKKVRQVPDQNRPPPQHARSADAPNRRYGVTVWPSCSILRTT